MYYSDSMCHFGIKGMRWGHRKKPETITSGAKKNVDYTDHGDGRIEIKAGAPIQRLVGGVSKSGLAGMTYASFTQHDNNAYIKGIAGKGPLGGGRDTKLTLRTKEPLKSPSVDDAAKMFFTVLKNDKKVRDAYANDMFGNKYSDKQLNDMISGTNLKKLRSEYSYANSALVMQDKSYIRDPFFKSVKQNGYNMLRDENDVRSKLSKAPIIVLDGAKSLEITKQESISDAMRKGSKTYIKQYKKYGEDWMSKQGFK